jgi:hypothetical protein
VLQFFQRLDQGVEAQIRGGLDLPDAGAIVVQQ